MKDRILEKRFKIIIFFVCFILFLFKANMSSFNMYSIFLAQVPKSEVLTLGTERGIRSDEWGVSTPLQLYQSKSGNFSESKFIGTENTNLSVFGNNIPTKDITIIGKPFTWGFFFFGSEYGLSWFYIIRFLCLILFSFELIKILTQNIKVASIFSLIIAFSPGIGWWSVGVPEVIIYFESIIVFLYYFFLTDNKYRKFIYATLLIVSITGYWNVIYPPTQIPLMYLMIFSIIGIYLNDKKEKIKLKKSDLLYVIYTCISVIVIMYIFFKNSKEALNIIANTTYPGKRVITGGGHPGFFTLMRYVFFPLLPYPMIQYSPLVDNVSRFSGHITLFPFPLLIYLLYYKYLKKNKILFVYFLYLIFCLCWFFIKFPLFIGQITMLKMVPEIRMEIIFGFANIIFIAMLVSEIPENIQRIKFLKKLCLMGIIGICFFACTWKMRLGNVYAVKTQFSKFSYLSMLFLFTFLVYFLIERKIKKFIILFFVTVLISGITINPINFGNKSLDRYYLHYELKKIDPNRNGIWATLDDLWVAKYILSQGYKSFNSIHYPPHNKLWLNLGFSKKEEYEIYNRYAHVSLRLAKSKKIELYQTDVIIVYLTGEDLKKLGINYLINRGEIKNSNEYGLKELKQIPEDNIYIYNVSR